MKYHSRTVSWRFRESSELPELKEKTSITIHSSLPTTQDIMKSASSPN
jgi:hypothetical protein